MGGSRELDARNDVLSGSRSVLQKGILDPTWRPADGFRKHAMSFVRFLTWSEAGGVLARNVVLLSADGRVAIDRQEIAAHLGPHHHRPPEKTHR